MPSAFSVSKAYSISFRLPSASGGAITANRPNRAWMVAHGLGAEFVQLPRHAPGFLIVAEPHTGLCDRKDRGGDSALVHIFERTSRAPGRHAGAASARCQGVAVELRDEMMVDVDAGFRRRILRLRRRADDPTGGG